MHRGTLPSLFLVLVIAGVARGETIEGLIASGELEARVVVKTPAPHLQKAPVEIAVEVGTARWFKRGTRVRDFTVPGTLVRPSSKFAFNETRRREGDTWSFQSWSFRLYAERTGTLRPPAVTTFISVDTETHGVVEGEIQLPVPPLNIEAPPGTEGLDSWVAATAFEIEESWEGVLETYQVGDAVTRIRRSTIQDVPAMAIPTSPAIELDGVQAYHAPPRVRDKSVRGSLEGTREERVVFTLETGGTHTIPGDRIVWFNLETGAVEQIDLPGRTLDVAGAATPRTTATSEPGGEKGNPWSWGLAVLSAALGLSLVRRLLRTTAVHSLRNHLAVWRGHRRTRADFLRAAGQQDSRRCLALLYQRMAEHDEWQLSTACAADPQLRAICAALMAHAYGEGEPPTTSDLQRLWQVCPTPNQRRVRRSALRLNPGPSS